MTLPESEKTPVRIMINAHYEQAFDNRKFFYIRRILMIRQSEISIIDFCEQFDNVNSDTPVCLIISNGTYETFLKCKKKNVNFWPMMSKGIRFFIDGSEIDSHGMMPKAERCEILEDEISIDYRIYDCSYKNYLICISVLKE